MSSMKDNIEQAVSQFVESCGSDYEFPAGGAIEIFTDRELKLLTELRREGIAAQEIIEIVSENLDWKACYSLVILGVRAAIYAVRNAHLESYHTGLLLLIAGSPKVDWRDVLGAFAIFETCGARLNIDFREKVESFARLGDEQKLRSTLDGYFRRNSDMRSIETMGLTEVGSGSRLSFRANAWL